MKVIKFWAPWCGPCRKYAPAFDQFKEENPEVETLEFNVDGGWDGARIFGIKSIPATVFLCCGKYEIHSGAMTVEQITDKIKGYGEEKDCC